MPYNPSQPRVPAGVEEGGQWTEGSFFEDASQWIHPGTGQKRIYLNRHDAGGFDTKVYIEDGEYAGMKWQANMKSGGGFGSTSAASIRAGSNNPRDVAAEAAFVLIKKHGINPNSATFNDLWKYARPEKLKRSTFETLDNVKKAKFMKSGGRLYD